MSDSMPENSDKPCDTGSSLAILTKEFPTVSFSDVDPKWPAKTGKYAYERDAVLQRGHDARLWLRRRPEKVVAIVTHSAFLRTSVAYSRFANADFRVFDFAEGEDNVALLQWQMSDVRGGGMGRSPRGRVGVEPGDFRSEDENAEIVPSITNREVSA